MTRDYWAPSGLLLCAIFLSHRVMRAALWNAVDRSGLGRGVIEHTQLEQPIRAELILINQFGDEEQACATTNQASNIVVTKHLRGFERNRSALSRPNDAYTEYVAKGIPRRYPIWRLNGSCPADPDVSRWASAGILDVNINHGMLFREHSQALSLLHSEP